MTAESTRIHIAAPTPYDVLVGRSVTARVTELLPPTATRVLVAYAGSVTSVAETVAARLREQGQQVVLAQVPDRESAKTLETAADLWSRLAQAGFTRTDVIVAVGGGTVTDLAGFVAASWLRGVSWIAIPTTVLAMVDAAVGGKTGVNIAEGKNLVGAFHDPIGVLCDVDTLATLPRADVVAGLAEVVKAGFIADPTILDLVEAEPTLAFAVDGQVLAELITRAISVKADVVGADRTEQGLREILNYGHTLGHALEQASGYRMRHGEAVAIGMVYAAELAHRAGRLDAATLARHRATLAAVGLPTAYDGPATFEDLLTVMGRDKKTRGARLRFVVLDGLARPGRFEAPDEALLRAAFEAVRA